MGTIAEARAPTPPPPSLSPAPAPAPAPAAYNTYFPALDPSNYDGPLEVSGLTYGLVAKSKDVKRRKKGKKDASYPVELVGPVDTVEAPAEPEPSFEFN